jgi:hypothetical protein
MNRSPTDGSVAMEVCSTPRASGGAVHSRTLVVAFVSICISIVFDGTGAAQEPAATSAPRPVLRATVPPTLDVRLDGYLSEAIWETAESIGKLGTVEPEEGGNPAGQTIVKVLASTTDLYIGIQCLDPEPAKIVTFSKARDAELDEEDHVLLVLDTFLDGRSGYVFAVNPSGTRFDGLITGAGNDVNSNWDTIWAAKTTRDANGWSTEIWIPIKSIGFKTGLTSWGLNVERRVQRLQETSRWSAVSQDYEIFQMSRSGLLTNLPNFNQGRGLTLRPALTAGLGRPAPDEPRDYTRDVSLDLTQKLGTNVLGSLTVNTDFAETEVDARQTNLSRFELFFPEKRAFFLEGADIFEFGMGLDDVLIPFFSRRIGLNDDGVEIPINVGGKLNGRVGQTNVGALVVNTRDAEGLDSGQATMGAARVKQNILAESSVGMIATVGDQLGRPGSWMTGADFTYQTSQFRGDKNLAFSVWGLVNDRDDLEGRKNAFGFGVDYPNDLWSGRLISTRIGDGFDPSIGFVPRQGIHVWDGEVAFDPRPGWSRVRQTFHGSSFSLVSDLDNRWETYEIEVKPFDWLFESGDRLEFNVSGEGDRPDEEFDVFDNEENIVLVPAGSYEWKRYEAKLTSAEKRRFTTTLKWESGGFYDGDLDTIEASVGIRQSTIALELITERNMGTLPGGDFTQTLYSARAELKFSPDFQVSSFIQYDNESNSMGTNTRLRWTFSPLGDLFVVYNHNLHQSISELASRRWDLESNALIVKLQYSWRP